MIAAEIKAMKSIATQSATVSRELQGLNFSASQKATKGMRKNDCNFPDRQR